MPDHRYPVHHQPRLLKVLNTQRILELIGENQGLSRSQIAELCSVSKPTASASVAELLRRRLIMEIGKSSDKVGRKGEKLVLNTDAAKTWLMGIVVGVKTSWVISGNLRGERLEPGLPFATPHSYEEFLFSLKTACAMVRNNFSCSPVGCAISMPGMGDDLSGGIHLCPNIRYLDGRNVVQELQRELGVKTVQIQDVRAVALGAISFGKNGRFGNSFCLNIDEGVGGALVLNGELYPGTNNASGEIGHIPVKGGDRPCGCGQTGCLETMVGITGLLRTWKENHPAGDAPDSFYELCRIHPDQARRVFFDTFPCLSAALKSVIQLFDPEAIFLHGEIWSLIPGSVEELKKYFPHSPEIRRTETSSAQGLFASIVKRIVLPGLAVSGQRGD